MKSLLAFDEDTTAIEVAWIRILTFGLMVYKLLSREFYVIAEAPEWLLNVYPNGQFAASAGYAALGFKGVVDLATLHVVHLWIPLPSTTWLMAIQGATILLCSLVVLLGTGPMNILAILSYALPSHIV